MNDMLRVEVADGKYTVVQDKKGRLTCLRYNEPWRDCVGDNLIHALAAEVQELRDKLNQILPDKNVKVPKYVLLTEGYDPEKLNKKCTCNCEYECGCENSNVLLGIIGE